MRDAFSKMDQSEVKINIIHAAVGGITETDVTLAAASDAIIIGFNVRPTGKTREVAEREKVDIRLYRVIYQAIEDINAARVGLLSPDIVERIPASQRFAIPLRCLRLALLLVAISRKVSLAATIRYVLFVTAPLSTKAILAAFVDSRTTSRLLLVVMNAALASRDTRILRLATQSKASVSLKLKGPNNEAGFFQPQG